MKLKEYLIKKAEIVKAPEGALDSTTARMFNHFYAAARHKGIPIKDTRLVTEGNYGAYTLDPLDTDDMYISLSHPSIAALSHEAGHVRSKHLIGGGTASINAAASGLPIISDIGTLVMEGEANHNSAKMLKEMYGDDPKLLSTINKDRWNVLPKGYSTYLMLHGIPLVGAALGGYLGWRKYKKGNKKSDSAAKIIDRLDLSDEEKKRLKKNIKKPSKLLNLLIGVCLGYIGGSVIGSGTTILTAPSIASSMLNSSSKFNNDNNILDMMRDHAKRNGYYTEDLDTNVSGQSNLTTPVPDLAYDNTDPISNTILTDIKQAPLGSKLNK